MQPGLAAPFFFLLFAEFQPDDLHAHPVVAHAREEAEKAGDRRILEVVVAEHIAPARDPQRGAIRVGGHDLREFTCDSLKNAPIIILDEATASIGPENEHLIQQAISELTCGKTIIIIAHRLATIQNADQILVVADGRIAEHGTHAELVQQDGLYRRFTAIREQAEGWRIAAE